MGWGESLTSIVYALDAAESSPSGLGSRAPSAGFLQANSHTCDPKQDPYCERENLYIILVAGTLAIALVVVICSLSLIRDEESADITPLCPGMIVQKAFQRFKLDFDAGMQLIIRDFDDDALCRATIEFSDISRKGFNGVAASSRLHTMQGLTLATAVVRHVAVAGQGIALCRAGCEIFGFVDPNGEDSFIVRHRSGVQLLTISGNLTSTGVSFHNMAGVELCNTRRVGDSCFGRILQHSDAGLVFCCLLAIHLHATVSARSKEKVLTPTRGPSAARPATHLSSRRKAESTPKSPKLKSPKPESTRGSRKLGQSTPEMRPVGADSSESGEEWRKWFAENHGFRGGGECGVSGSKIGSSSGSGSGSGELDSAQTGSEECPSDAPAGCCSSDDYATGRGASPHATAARTSAHEVKPVISENGDTGGSCQH